MLPEYRQWVAQSLSLVLLMFFLSHCSDSGPVRDRGTPQMTGSSLETLGLWGELVGVAQAVIWLKVDTIVFSKSKSWFYREGVPVGLECYLHGAFPWLSTARGYLKAINKKRTKAATCMESVSAFRKERNLSTRQADLTPVFITSSMFPKSWSQFILKCPAIVPREFLKSVGFDLEGLRSHQGQTSLFSWTRSELLPGVYLLPGPAVKDISSSGPWSWSAPQQNSWVKWRIQQKAQAQSYSCTCAHMYSLHTHVHSSKYLSLSENMQP